MWRVVASVLLASVVAYHTIILLSSYLGMVLHNIPR